MITVRDEGEGHEGATEAESRKPPLLLSKVFLRVGGVALDPPRRYKYHIIACTLLT